MPLRFRRKPALLVLLVVLGVPLGLCLALPLLIPAINYGVPWAPAGLDAQLVADVQAFARATYPRPSHVEPALAGTFGQQLEPLLPRVLALHAAEPVLDEETRTRCADVRVGKRPLPELPGTCRAALERGRALLGEVLQATHAREGGLPYPLRLVREEEDVMLPLQHLARLSALQLRDALEAGHPSEALTLCLDTLALSREAGLGAGLLGAMISAAIQGIVAPGCAESLAALPPAELPRAVAGLQRLREGRSRFSQALRDEDVLVRLRTWSPMLGEAHRAALPQPLPTPYPLDLDVSDGPFAGGWFMRPVAYHARGWYARHLPALYATADLPRAERRASAEALAQEARASLNPLVRQGVPDFARLADRYDALFARHDALLAAAQVALARAEQGRWPTSLEGFVPGGPVPPPRLVVLDAQRARVETEDRSEAGLTIALQVADAAAAQAHPAVP